MFLSLAPVLRGALFSLLGYTIWACGDALTKGGGLGGLSAVMIAEISSWGALLPFLLVLSVRGKLHKIKPVDWKRQGLRSVLFVFCSFCCFLAFTNLPLTTVYIGIFLSPLLISLFGALFLREPLSRSQLFAILVGFVGVSLALTLGHEERQVAGENPTLGYIILPFFLFFTVAEMLFLRVLGRTETAESLATLPFLVRGLLLLPIFLFVAPTDLPLVPVLFVTLMGFCTSLGYLAMAQAYKLAPVTIVSAFHYSQLISGSLLGFLFWQSIPSPWEIGGGALVVLSGLLVTREARRRHEAVLEETLLIRERVENETA